MAAKRGKSQARRSGGNHAGIPGWAWMVLGILLAVVAMIVLPKYLKSDGDGFFRPQPNPDAQPVAVAGEEDAVAPEGDAAPKARPAGTDDREDYAFYDLLPGKEVPLSDAELAATEQAEARRDAARRQAAQDAAEVRGPDATTDATSLPRPVDDGAPAVAAPSADSVAIAPPATSSATDDTARYLLQAGAFQASGQAEEMKARIALLGLGARVESAQISGKTVYRVRMGPFGTAGDLAEAKRKLTAGGLSAMAIRVK